MAARDQQHLASKEAGLFRQVVKFYESKQYKKGVKAADQVLATSIVRGQHTSTPFGGRTCQCRALLTRANKK